MRKGIKCAPINIRLSIRGGENEQLLHTQNVCYTRKLAIEEVMNVQIFSMLLLKSIE